MNSIENEIWRPVVGFERYYEVSNKGRVRRKKGITKYKDGRLARFSQTILKQLKHGKGYRAVYLSKKSNKTTALIHRLVAKAFIPNPENKDQVNHIDYNKINNRVENLEWCTNKENVYHAIENGSLLLTTKKGSKNGQSILTESKVKEIRNKYRPTIYTRKMLADEYGVKVATIKDVVQRRSWKHVV